MIRKALSGMGYVLFDTHKHYGADGLYSVHSDGFRRNAMFRTAYERGIKASRGVDPQFEWRVHIALWAASMALSVPGDFVELGVNAGFISSAIMQRLDWKQLERSFYLVDTFTGPVLSQFSKKERSRGRPEIAQRALAAGAYVTDVDSVRANFSEWPRAVVIQGTVPEILASLPANNLAFLHLDMNCAYPERAALEFLWERLSVGALILFDDYGYFGHDSQTEEIDEAVKRLGCEILSLPTGQGIVLKSRVG